MPFSWKERDRALESIERLPPEVLIIGGGIVGCATAAAAARLGLNVLLVEKEDLASGASGNSTGLAHAGLRYLAQGRLGFVFQAGRERQRLQEIAPHWVRPFNFVLPVYKTDAYSFRMVRLGTWIYDLFSLIDAWLSKRPPSRRHRVLSATELSSRTPGIKTDGLLGGVEYFVDAQMQDSRLTMGFAQAAALKGARVVTHVQVAGIQKRPEGGMVVQLRDRLANKDYNLRPQIVLNATGAWIDELRLMMGFKSTSVMTSRGIHLVVDHLTDTPLIMNTEIKGKVFFILPIDAEVSLIGTTESPLHSSVDATRPDNKEVDELLHRLLNVFPYLKQGANLQEAITRYKEVHVRRVFWGVRPLLNQRGSSLRASREHLLIKETRTFWSIPGVKLTSGHAVGQKIARELWKTIKSDALPKRLQDSLPGGELWDYERTVNDALRRFKLGEGSDQIIRYLISMYGTRYVEVLQWANREPHYRERILQSEPWILAQVPYAIQEEMVLTLNDLLWRRTRWALWRSLPDETVAGISQEMAEILGWSADRRQAEFQDYLQEKTRHNLP